MAIKRVAFISAEHESELVEIRVRLVHKDKDSWDKREAAAKRLNFLVDSVVRNTLNIPGGHYLSNIKLGVK